MLQLKLEVPRLPTNVVDRPRLTTALEALSACRLVLLTAPAGFGKTTLLSQWGRHLTDRGHWVAWLSVDNDDAEARRFLTATVRALETAGLDMSSLAPRAEIGFVEMTIDAIVRELVATLARSDAPVTLVLDDYHRAACEALDAVVMRLLSLLPDGVRILMSVRRRPGIDVDRLLASGMAVELGSDVLRFTEGEARELLDTGLSDTDLQALAERVEGWPVALQLTRLLSLQDHAVPAALERLTSRSGHLWSFLTDQVLRGLPDDCVDFLLDTSILERFSSEIADSMRGRRDSWAIMERLDPLQSLLTAIDADNIWFRYHHLFAEYLQGQLRQRRPTDVADLHLRASTAFEKSGMLVEAVRHSSLAGDYARCADLVEQAGGWQLILFGGLDQLQQLLDLIPKAERLSHPRLLVAEAYLSLKLGAVREARLTFDLVAVDPPDLTIGRQQLDDFGRDVLNVGVLIRTYEDNSIDRAFLDGFTSHYEAPDETHRDDGLTRGVLLCAGAATALCLGELSRAEDFARGAMGSMRSVNSVLGLNYCFLHAGIACTYRGDLRAAFAYLGRAEAMAAENFGADSGLKAISHTVLAAANLWKEGRLVSEAADLDDAFHHVRNYDGWFEIYSSGLDTRFRHAWMANDDAAMEAVVADGTALVEERGLERLAAIVDAQRLLRPGASRSASLAALADRLDHQFPRGCWKQDRSRWRGLQDAGFALAIWYRESASDRAAAIASDLIACAREVGALVFETRGLVLRASIAVAAQRSRDAMADLRRAVEIASEEHIMLPFLEQPNLRSLIAEVERGLWEHGGRPVEASFLSDVLRRLDSRTRENDSILGLSIREQEVMRELSQGLTNKEIARALDMTEHTVKFHLKNIFAKLGVDRRAHALALFQSTERSDDTRAPYP